MSAAQADEFASHYAVVTQFNDTVTSFSATVFADASGNLTLAIRGTLELTGTPNDLTPTDLTLISWGAGYDQIVAMVNWWQRATAPSGQVAQYALVEYPNAQAVLPPADALRLFQTELAFGGRHLYLVRAADAAASGELVAARGADGDGRVDVTGHSLGSHLALAFNTLFPAQVAQVVGFNGPGFIDTPTNRSFFARMGGALPVDGNSANVTNVKADESGVGQQPWSAAAGLHSRPGVDVDIAIEDQWLSDEPSPTIGAWNHSQMVLTDSLAVYALLAQLDPTLSATRYKSMLGAVAVGTAASYERTVDALQRLLNTDDALLPVGNQTPSRDALYQAIYDLRGRAAYATLAGKLRIEPSSKDLAVKARTDFSALASLLSLSPIVLTAVGGANQTTLDGVLRAAWGQTYDDWLADKNMSFAERTAGKGTTTDAWIVDRTAMLVAINAKNTRNEPYPTTSYRDGLKPTTSYVDLASGITLNSGNSGETQLAQIIFGRNDADTRSGGNRADRLYGGNGGDKLSGGDNDDRLEGQNGNDTLNGGLDMDTLYGGAGDDSLSGDADNDLLLGGQGTDTYQFTAGWGSDIVQDSDGLGRLMVGTAQLTGGKLIAPGVYRSADGKINYTFDSTGRTLSIGFEATAGFAERGDSIVVRNWQSGELGLLFDEVPTVVNTDITLAGNAAPNNLVIPNKGYASASITGLDGDDVLQEIGVGVSGLINGGTPPTLDWAADRDLLDGGNGADRLWGDWSVKYFLSIDPNTGQSFYDLAWTLAYLHGDDTLDGGITGLLSRPGLAAGIGMTRVSQLAYRARSFSGQRRRPTDGCHESASFLLRDAA